MNGPTRRRRAPNRCRLCEQRVLWATTTARGRRIALEPEPHPQGRFAVRTGTWGLYARVLDDADDRQPGETLHRPHAAVCPSVRDRRLPQLPRAVR